MTIRALGLMGVLLAGAPALAQEAPEKPAAAEPSDKDEAPAEETDGDDGAEEVDEQAAEESLTGTKLPPLPSVPQSASPSAERLAQIAKEKADADSPYPATTWLGAETLGLEPRYVFEVQRGVELIYLRDYSGARDHFLKLEEAYPDTGVAQVVDVLVWQALMLENFDFRYDNQYWVSSKKARTALDAALEKEGGNGWEHLLYTGVSGIESIHTMRQQQYTKALSLAFEAMGHLTEAKNAAPDFPDLLLADGMYNYWRTVVTMSSKMLPDFGDHRVEGIEQVQSVEANGVFLGPAATLSMAFTWLEEGQNKKALAACQKNRRAYPKNVINNLVTGSTYVYLKQFDNALTVFDEVLAVDPKNDRVHYWRAVALLKKGEAKAAESEIRTYLGARHLESYQRASAYWRLGQTLARQKNWGGAAEAYQTAIKINKHKMARRALKKLNDRRKEGKINW